MYYIYCNGNKSKGIPKGNYFAHNDRGNPLFEATKKPLYYKEKYDAWYMGNLFTQILKDRGIRAKIVIKSAMVLNDSPVSLLEYDLMETVKLLLENGIVPSLYTDMGKIQDKIQAK